MKKYSILFFFLIFSLCIRAQNVGVGTSFPLNKLHVAGGFRLDTLVGVDGSGLLRHDANGVVYGIKFTGNSTDVLRGDGTFGSGGAGLTGWALTGNSGTNPANNFIGTTDDQPLSFRLNNIWAGQLNQLTRNYGIGLGSLQSNTTGTQNVGLGNWALLSNTTGSANTSIGHDALSRNIDGSNNTAVGNWALLLNTSGARNTAIGDNALSRNTTANDNTGLGFWALLNDTTGEANTAIGSGALYANAYAGYNTALGYGALNQNIGGSQNTAAGARALFNNTYGYDNTAIGLHALLNNTVGLRNTAIGFQALGLNVSSESNVAVGYNAGQSITNGFNTCIGANSWVGNGVFHSTAIGYNAGANTSNTMAFGNSSIVGFAFGRSSVQTGAALQVGFSSSIFGSTAGNGAYLSTGGTWTNGSSITFKEDFSSIDNKEILEKISSLNISRWRYKNSNNEYHIGPTAEEFYKVFNVGSDEKYLSTIDPSGVALAGIQELAKENQELRQLVNQLAKEVQALKEKMK